MYLTLKSSTAGTRFTKSNGHEDLTHIFKLASFPGISPLFLSHNVLFFPLSHFDALPLKFSLFVCVLQVSLLLLSLLNLFFCSHNAFFHSLTLLLSHKSLLLLLFSGLVSSRWGDSFIKELRAEVINCGMSDRDSISSAGKALCALVLQAGRCIRTGSDTAGVCHQPAIT